MIYFMEGTGISGWEIAGTEISVIAGEANISVIAGGTEICNVGLECVTLPLRGREGEIGGQ